MSGNHVNRAQARRRSGVEGFEGLGLSGAHVEFMVHGPELFGAQTFLFRVYRTVYRFKGNCLPLKASCEVNHAQAQASRVSA